MCLDRIIPEIPKSIRRKKYGYKVFRPNNDGTFEAELSGNGEPYPVNEWVKEEDYRDGGYKNVRLLYEKDKYPFGFHAFLTEKDAKGWLVGSYKDAVIRKIEFDDLRAYGEQSSKTGIKKAVIVGKMKILERGVKCKK